MQDEPSADYPLGGLIEPYDIEREKEMTEDGYTIAAPGHDGKLNIILQASHKTL